MVSYFVSEVNNTVSELLFPNYHSLALISNSGPLYKEVLNKKKGNLGTVSNLHRPLFLVWPFGKSKDKN